MALVACVVAIFPIPFQPDSIAPATLDDRYSIDGCGSPPPRIVPLRDRGPTAVPGPPSPCGYGPGPLSAESGGG